MLCSSTKTAHRHPAPYRRVEASRGEANERLHLTHVRARRLCGDGDGVEGGRVVCVDAAFGMSSLRRRLSGKELLAKSKRFRWTRDQGATSAATHALRNKVSPVPRLLLQSTVPLVAQFDIHSQQGR